MALGIYVSWENDNDRLRSRALEITGTLRTDAERIIAISSSVYHTGGFKKNYRYFLLPQLGPTPIQVLESGGNCADKSRLITAMLNELGVRASILMIYPCADCAPIHSVIEAVYERGRMVVDPVWNVYYPADNDRFLGVAELAGTDLGRRRLRQLQQENGPDENAVEKISLMSEAEATFDFTKSINWEKHWAMRAASGMLQIVGSPPENIIRPRILEDPKLATSMMLVAGAIGWIALGICAISIRRTRQGMLFGSMYRCSLERLRSMYLLRARP